MKPREWTPITKASGRSIGRSTLSMGCGDPSCSSSSVDILVSLFSDAGGIGFSFALPVSIHRPIAANVKFTAISIALGRYVPMLTNLLLAINR